MPVEDSDEEEVGGQQGQGEEARQHAAPDVCACPMPCAREWVGLGVLEVGAVARAAPMCCLPGRTAQTQALPPRPAPPPPALAQDLYDHTGPHQ